MKVQVKNNGKTVSITDVQVWQVGETLQVQIGVAQTYFYAQAPTDANLHNGSFCIQFYANTDALLPNNTRVLFFPETAKERVLCADCELYEQVIRGTFGFVLSRRPNELECKQSLTLWEHTTEDDVSPRE